MGKRKNESISSKERRPPPQRQPSKEPDDVELLKTMGMGEPTPKETWDSVFNIRGVDDSFEWYVEWADLQPLLTEHLTFPSSSTTPISILVAGCGDSRLSEHLYDAGFTNITNVHSSEVVISVMMRRNVRERPQMKWRVMGMTDMKFEDDCFDIVIDKGGLDSLMGPEKTSRLGDKYLNQIRRIVNYGGRFICFTCGKANVLDFLFRKFRFEWKTSVVIVDCDSSACPEQLTLMIVSEKEIGEECYEIPLPVGSPQVSRLDEALERENMVRSEFVRDPIVVKALADLGKVRSDYLGDSNIADSLLDQSQWGKGELAVLQPGRSRSMILGELGISRFKYRVVILDPLGDHGPFLRDLCVFIVSRRRQPEWLYMTENGQWMLAARMRSARTVMILLDSSNYNVSMEEMQMDLYPFAKKMIPVGRDNGKPITFFSENEELHHEILHEVTSIVTGPIIVDEVIYDKIYEIFRPPLPSKDLLFRRLIFQRSGSWVQSEALMQCEVMETEAPSTSGWDEVKVQAGSRTREKGKAKKSDFPTTESHAAAPIVEKSIDRKYLTS